MRLKKETKTILNMVAPDWMKRFVKAGWNKLNLPLFERDQLVSNPVRCFMGEIHHYTGLYNLVQDPSFCSKCSFFSSYIAYIMKPGVEDDTKNQLLDQIAGHVKKFHPEILKNR